MSNYSKENELRKDYMMDVYSKYWINARERIYGFMEYDKNLSYYICKHIPKGGKLLEVACGTGYPFSDFFQKQMYSVYGIDISSDLIEKCRQLNPNINAKVGDAENIDFPNDYFDCVYCFHSTWYFPNLNKAIDEMVRVTSPGGIVIFDIQNRNNQDINRGYEKRVVYSKSIRCKIKLYISNVIKVFLRRGDVFWHSVVHEVPTYPEDIYAHLKLRSLPFYVMVRKDESIEERNELSSFGIFDRLVFFIRKQGKC